MISLNNKECIVWRNKQVFIVNSEKLFKMSDVIVSNAHLNKQLTICHRIAR